MTSIEGIDDGVGYGVSGQSNSGKGVCGFSDINYGVYGYSVRGYAVYGDSNSGYGVKGRSYSSTGVDGSSVSGLGVFGYSSSNYGVYGSSYNSYGVYGDSYNNVGISGYSYNGIGVDGRSENSYGVRGRSYGSLGVFGYSESNVGVYGSCRLESAWAAYFNGKVHIGGLLTKTAGSFKIDHPLDPANKYLYHSFVESSDMKNVYDGVVALDEKGEAEIELPDWFSALNMDFRYQLTAIGAPGPNLYIAEEIAATNYNSSNNNKNNKSSSFKVAGGTSGMKVSWQVTGIRKDPWANANRIQVEEDKPAKEQGYYMYPELYGQPEEKRVNRLLFPEEENQELLINENRPAD
jgi:hypothetical protein